MPRREHRNAQRSRPAKLAGEGLGSVTLDELVSGDLLTPRAKAFLRSQAERCELLYDPSADRMEAAECEAWSGVSADRIIEWLSLLRRRYGGIKYWSRSWSFEEEAILFSPYLDCDEDDGEPMATIVDHTVAYPFGVWGNMKDEACYMSPGRPGGEYIKVFDRVEGIIESDAIHFESRIYRLVGAGGSETSSLVSRIASERLQLMPEGSGATEKWWQGDGFRVHVWNTLAKVYQQPELSKWSVRAERDSAEGRARDFLDSCLRK